MNMMKSGTARGIATRAHYEQTDKNGDRYILHVDRVARLAVTREYARTEEHDDEMYAVAYLHDVIEDTTVTMDDLKEKGLNLHQQQALNALTRRGVRHPEYAETYDEYIERVALHPMARRIKLADLYDNMDPLRVMLGGSPSLLRRYVRAYTKLTAAEFAANGDEAEGRR